ncbi:MAG: gamma-glutamyl-gamma-aminobutyrate hydrolase family protein, partial [Bdellovibrio sp.]
DKPMNLLKIGITPSFFQPDIKRKTFGRKTLIYYEKEMAQWILNAGHLPVLIPQPPKSFRLKKLIENLDALIFFGGTDIHPQLYGETPLLKNSEYDPERDALELDIFKNALELQKPILGICRGAQLINVACGGTLYQDIPTQIQGALKHRDAVIYDKLFHHIQLTENAFHLKKIYPGQSQLLVNSVHHQAIKDLGQDLIVEAQCAEDGIIEALRYAKESPFVLGVQWHPEFMQKISQAKAQNSTSTEKVANPQALIQYFLKQVKKES